MENMTLNSSEAICNLHRSPISRAFFGSALVAVAVVGAIGNFVLSYFVIRKSEMRSLVNILLATMAISDALISVLCTPFDFLAIIYNECIFSELMCCVHSFLLSFLVVLNVAMLVILSLDRYFILVLKKDKLRGCHIATMLSLCVTFSVAVSCPPLFDPGNMVFANEHCRQAYEVTKIHTAYSLVFSSFLFLLPCGLLLLAYVHIIMVIRKTKRAVRPQCVRSERSFARQIRVNFKFKQKTFSTILYLYAAAMVCKLPLAVSVFVKTLTVHAVCPMAQWIMLLTYLNSAVNPFIYAAKISGYWLMLTGKFHDCKNQIMSFRRKSSRHNQLSEPQNIYTIDSDALSSVI